MINLLPKNALRRANLEYRLRLTAVWAFALAALLFALAALLMPSYFFAMLARTQSASEEKQVDASLSASQSAGAAAEEKSAALLYATVGTEMQFPRPSEVVDSLTEASHTGVVLQRIEYRYTSGGATVNLTGDALTRSDLLAYKQALASIPGIGNINLPLSTLALSQNIPFLISLVYAPPSGAPASTPAQSSDNKTSANEPMSPQTKTASSSLPEAASPSAASSSSARRETVSASAASNTPSRL